MEGNRDFPVHNVAQSVSGHILSTMPTYAQLFPSPDSGARQCGVQSKVGIRGAPFGSASSSQIP